MNNGVHQNFVVGTKQTLKAAKQNIINICYIAKDADSRNVDEVICICEKNDTDIVYIDTMKELGNKFKVKVGAACAAKLI